MKSYVAGFLLNAGCTHVALIEKIKPEWQRGKMNAIGGSIDLISSVRHDSDPFSPPHDTYEPPVVAMVREFREETGMKTSELDWKEFCVLSGDGFKVHFFYAVAGVQDIAKRLQTTTAERVVVEPIRHNRRRIPNLEWLIPMAISAYMGENSAAVHFVSEVA